MQRHQTVCTQCGRCTEAYLSAVKNWDSRRPVPPSLAKTRSLEEAKARWNYLLMILGTPPVLHEFPVGPGNGKKNKSSIPQTSREATPTFFLSTNANRKVSWTARKSSHFRALFIWWPCLHEVCKLWVTARTEACRTQSVLFLTANGEHL